MIINKNWDLDIAFEVINNRYYPGGLQSGPQRNRQIETWGQLVGKTRALEQLDSLIASCGSINKMSQSVRMSSGSIKNLESFLSLFLMNWKSLKIMFNINSLRVRFVL